MQPVLNLYKPISVTPLQLITQLQEAYPEYKNVKLAYAGRLDPMAEGVLLVLMGEECKRRESYERLKKEYEFEVLFGISTDTYDVMGRIENITRNTEHVTYNMKHKTWNIERKTKGNEDTFLRSRLGDPFTVRPFRMNPSGEAQAKIVSSFLKQFIGKYLQPYPPYSSARVSGKPLYYWARENKLDQIKIPQKEIEVYDLKYLGEKYITTEDLLKTITDRITKVDGKFRQTEILQKWEDYLSKFSNFNPPAGGQISNFSISCTSGTYVRSIANEIGKKLGVASLAYTIKRTKVGDFRIEDSLKI